MAEVAVCVLDNGTDEIRVGFSGEDLPFSEFPNIVGEPRFGTLCGIPPGGETIRFGEDVLKSYGLLRTQRPMSHGKIENWDSMEHVWSCMFSTELRQESSDLPLLFLKKEGSSKGELRAIQEVFFEKFQTPLMNMVSQGYVLCQSLNVTTGCFVTMGTCITIVNVYEGHHLEQFDRRYDFGGEEVTEMLGKILSTRYGPSLAKGKDIDLELERIKKEACYVAQDFVDRLYGEQYLDIGHIHQLPDRKKINGRFIAPEIYFQPALYARTDKIPSLPSMIISAITSCPMDTWSELFGSIFIAGGESLYDGIVERLESEIQDQISCTARVNRINNPCCATWVAGSIVASQPVFPSFMISLQDYNEGHSLVR